MVFEKLKNDIIDNFMISKEMKDYLHTVDLSDRNLFEIMAGSLESLEVKLEWIGQLNDACEGKYNEQYFKLKNAIDKPAFYGRLLFRNNCGIKLVLEHTLSCFIRPSYHKICPTAREKAQKLKNRPIKSQ